MPRDEHAARWPSHSYSHSNSLTVCLCMVTPQTSKLLQRCTLRRAKSFEKSSRRRGVIRRRIEVAPKVCASQLRAALLRIDLLALFTVFYPCAVSHHEQAATWAPDLTVALQLQSRTLQGTLPRSVPFVQMRLRHPWAHVCCHQAAFELCRTCQGRSARFLAAFQLRNSRTTIT